MNETQIQRFKNYLKASAYYADDKTYIYMELRDAIRYALDTKMTYGETRLIIDELDKKGVIVLRGVYRGGIKTYKLA